MKPINPTSPDASRALWPAWARFLHQNRLTGLAAGFAETAGPLAILSANLIFVAEPLFGRGVANSGLHELADLLENPQELASFARYLREAGST